MSIKSALALTLASACLLTAAPASADVFSSQGFSGEETTLNNLPGVDLNAVPGFGGGSSNCEETDVPTFGRSGHQTLRGTTCNYGNFSITTTTGQGRNSPDLTYGGNAPPWLQGWRP